MITRHHAGFTTHQLEPGETWGDFGMEQPGRIFVHRTDWPYCPRCERKLRVKRERRRASEGV